MRAIVVGTVLISLGLSMPGQAENVAPEEARKIAKEATIYGFPMVDSGNFAS